MRLNLHDFSGHPFQVQLSRNLAARGHLVLHGYSTQYISGHGNLHVSSNDPQTLRIEGLSTAEPMVKYSPVGRTRFELAYADAWRKQLAAERFDLVISCNVPLIAMSRMRRHFAQQGQPWVLWHQDVYSAAMAAEAASRLPGPLARVVGAGLARTEKALVRDASAVVAIGSSFIRRYNEWGIRTDHVRLLPNWAPLDDVQPGPRNNAWATQHQVPDDAIRLMYAGTLGRKHNPRLLLELLDSVKARGVDVCLIVVSEGVGADDLAVAAAGRPDVQILGYQPADEFGMVLSSADIMVTLLEPNASQFSVPSKVLSYLSAGRPTVGLMPRGNPAADDICEAGGFVAEPTQAGARDAAAWVSKVKDDPQSLALLGQRARQLAERRFNIDTITDTFESILELAISATGTGSHQNAAREPIGREGT